MRIILILTVYLSSFAISQDWDHSQWEEYKLYKDNEIIDWGSRYWQDVECFEDDNCYAVSLNLLYNIEVFKLDKSNNYLVRYIII